MERNMVKRFLQSLNITITKNKTDWIRIPQLYQIAMNSDGNQELSPFRDKLQFDLNLDLIYVKQFRYWTISRAFNDSAKIENNKLIVKGRYGSLIRSLPEDKFFPGLRDLPKVGDVLFIIKNGELIDLNDNSGEITDIEISNGIAEISFSGNLSTDQLKNFMICFADGDKYNDGEHFEKNPAFVIFYKALTNEVVDTYLDFSEVAGFISKHAYNLW